MIDIEIVMQELERMKAEFNCKAFESETFSQEKRYQFQANILNDAIEYLWQYQDLME